MGLSGTFASLVKTLQIPKYRGFETPGKSGCGLCFIGVNTVERSPSASSG
jgi:hypothetical protein